MKGAASALECGSLRRAAAFPALRGQLAGRAPVAPTFRSAAGALTPQARTQLCAR
jgi:hypothetical protein